MTKPTKAPSKRITQRPTDEFMSGIVIKMPEEKPGPAPKNPLLVEVKASKRCVIL